MEEIHPACFNRVGMIHECDGTSVILASRGNDKPASRDNPRRKAQPTHQVLEFQQFGVGGERQRVNHKPALLEGSHHRR
jgi:hypothetical protein